MAFMKKQVNLFLLILVLLAIFLVAGMSILYQARFSDLSNNYLTKLDEYETCDSSLAQKTSELAETKQLLEENVKDVDKTVNLFEQKQLELESTEQALSSARSDISDLEGRVADLQDQIQSLMDTISTRNAEINSLTRQILDLQDEVDYLEEELDACG